MPKKSARWLRDHRGELDIVKLNGAITGVNSDVNAVHFVHNSWWRSPVHISQEHRDLYGLYQWLYTGINSYWEKQAFRKSKVVVAVSTKVAEELINIGVDPRKNSRDCQWSRPRRIHTGKHRKGGIRVTKKMSL